MGQISYSNVVLPYPMHQDFTVSAETEDSGTDWYLQKFRIKVQFLLNAQYLPLMGLTAVPAGTSPAGMMPFLHAALMKKRKTLSYKINGIEMIPPAQQGNNGSVDANNGPNPISFTYKDMTASTFLCFYDIEASYWNNPAIVNNQTVNKPGNDILYNRWTESISYDNCLYATRTRDGKARIRSDNVDGKTADLLRTQMAAVGVPPGFLRTKSQYTIDPSGLAIQYNLVDEEQFVMPPQPAYEASGEYAETVSRRGAWRVGRVSLTLKGAKTTSQALLLQAAVSTATKKLSYAIIGQANGLNTQNSIALDSSTIKVEMYKNEVHVDISCIMNASKDGKSRYAGLPMFRYENITNHPNSQIPAQGGTPAYPIMGTSNLLLQAASYYDPSLKETIMGAGGQFNNNRPPVGTLGIQGGTDV